MLKKYIFVTGGVVSSLGKGLTAASIGMLLESQGIKIAMMKLDPYLNVDPGTMNPFQHGEVYVTDDGTETDLDLGHYYRFTNSPLSKLSTSTAGQIYDSVIKCERRGDYLGDTVQVIPHVTDEIKKRIHLCSKQSKDIEVTLVEIGGTVGDIESLPFLEAIRQFRLECPEACINIHMTYVPYIKSAGEVKSKPTQHSVQQLRSIGIFPDLILCRSENGLEQSVKKKIALFCSVKEKLVFDQIDVSNSIYEVPNMLIDQKLDVTILNLLNIKNRGVSIKRWKNILNVYLSAKKTVTVGLVGKYTKHQDAYKSIIEALNHGAIANQVKVKIINYSSDELEKIDGCDGYVVPGGFGERGFEGKVLIAKMCREENKPYFGICLGVQALVVEFARSILNLKMANSTEIDPNTTDPVISLLKNQIGIENFGGTMRLGSFPCKIKMKTKAYEAYGKSLVYERHRHRFEFNNDYRESMESNGMVVSGIYKEWNLCEIIEIRDHPWMVGVQFHPEFKSKPTEPHPLFKSFIKSMIDG